MTRSKYFERVASADLMATVEPFIDNALKQVGAIPAYDSLISKYKGLPLVPDMKADLQAHATQLTLDGTFHYLAKEEADIRANPAARTFLKLCLGPSKNPPHSMLSNIAQAVRRG